MILEDLPCGAEAEHRQGSRTINAREQKRLRAEKRRGILAKKHREAMVKSNIISKILDRNETVENELRSKSASKSVEDATVSDFLLLSVSKLKDFIHLRKFTGHQFRVRQLAKPGASLNKSVYPKQTAQSIEEDCSDENPCLVWISWSVRKSTLVLEEYTLPETSDSFEMPQFSITGSGSDDQKFPSGYLQSASWVEALKSTVRCR